MKQFRKLLAFFCAALLLASVAAAPVSVPAAAVDGNTGWYSGDFDLDGKVQTDDARAILRIAAYIDPAPEAEILFGAADFDKDGRVTSRDARLALRVAAALPVEGFSPDAAAAAIRLLSEKTRVIKGELETGQQKSYVLTETIDPGEPDYEIKFSDLLKAGLDVMHFFMPNDVPSVDEMKAELASELSNTDILGKTGTTTTTYRCFRISSYDPSADYYEAILRAYQNYYSHVGATNDNDPNYYLNYVFNAPDGAADTVAPATVKNAAITYDPDGGTYTVRIDFNNFSVTENAASDTPLRKYVFSQVPSPAEMKELRDSMTADEDYMSMQLLDSITINKKTFTYRGVQVFNPTVSYTFSAETNIPLSADYSMSVKMEIPAEVHVSLSKGGRSAAGEIDIGLRTDTAYNSHFDFTLYIP